MRVTRRGPERRRAYRTGLRLGVPLQMVIRDWPRSCRREGSRGRVGTLLVRRQATDSSWDV